MLNPFPIQFLALFAYFILRFFVGAILIYLGFSHLRARHELKEVLRLSWWPFGKISTFLLITAELFLGTLILAGAFTQFAVLILMGLCIEMLFLRNHFNHPSIPPKIFYLLLLAASLSLFITGAGALAVDLPI